MKSRLFVFISLCCLLLAACNVAGETATAVPTRIPIVTETLLVATAAHTPIVMTETAVLTPLPATTMPPPTPQPTETPTETAVALPDHIYFLWDPKDLPRGEVIDPVQNLYLISDEIPNSLETSPVIEEIIGWPYISLSPDKTKFLLTNLEDRNGDGYVSFEGYNRGFDGPNVFTFSLLDSSLTRITSDYPIIFNPEWGVDGQTILYGQSTYALSTINVANGVSHLITAFPEDQITWTDVSPDGRLVALNLDSVLINIADTQTGGIILITNEIGGFGVERAWSPDSKWLVLSQPLTNQIFLINAEMLTVNPIEGLNTFSSFVWSPNSQQLAFVQDTNEGSTLMLLDPTDLSVQSLLNNQGSIYSLVWSPDGSQLAMAIALEEKVTLSVLDIESGDLRELWQNDESRRFYIPAWSPDGEWLLFFHGQGWPLSHGPDDEAGLYFIHQSGGEAHLILDTSNTSDPYGFFWLP